MHIINPLGNIRLKDLTAFQIQRTLNNLSAKGYSDSFVASVYVRLSSMIEQAIKMEMLKKNPCRAVILPKSGKKKIIDALTKEEQALLVDYCRASKNGSIFIFLLGTGMRIGEALALKWTNINFEKNEIYICQSSGEIKGHAKIYDRTKTPAGVRTIPLSSKIKALVLEIQSKQEPDKNKLNLVFPSSNYSLSLSSNVRTRFAKYCQAAGIRKVNIHVLRHTFATRAIEQNINIKVLSCILGHKDIKVTLNTYAHVLPEFKNDSFSRIDIFN